MRWQRAARVGMVAAALAVGACATGPRGTPAAARPAVDLTGVWEGSFRSTVEEGPGAGDTRVERQAWRLSQAGDAVVGFYVVELTMLSGDGRPYRCSGEPRFSTLVRVEVRGKVSGDGIDLVEVGTPAAKGACRPTFPRAVRYRAAVAGGVLTILDGERRLPLRRPAARSGAEQLLAFDERALPSVSVALAPDGEATGSHPAEVDGLWVWENRGLMPSGDEKIEREEWHLEQEGTKVTGYYDRAVRHVSTDGHAYRCSRALEFHVVTRYHVTGEVRGDALVIWERGFEILEASPCDDGQRRLDAYRGQAAPGEIRLVLGVGTQVLKRARPNVPTQRF